MLSSNALLCASLPKSPTPLIQIGKMCYFCDAMKAQKSPGITFLTVFQLWMTITLPKINIFSQFFFIFLVWQFFINV